MARKSYNPFTMWGAYLGGLIGFLIPFNCHTIPSFTIPIRWECAVPYFPHIIQLAFMGFLTGWGIQSFFRALRN